MSVRPPKEYVERRLDCAAYLETLGHRRLRISGTGRRRMFHYPAEAWLDVASFYDGGTVNARTYATILRELKALVRHAPAEDANDDRLDAIDRR